MKTEAGWLAGACVCVEGTCLSLNIHETGWTCSALVCLYYSNQQCSILSIYHPSRSSISSPWCRFCISMAHHTAPMMTMQWHDTVQDGYRVLECIRHTAISVHRLTYVHWIIHRRRLVICGWLGRLPLLQYWIIETCRDSWLSCTHHIIVWEGESATVYPLRSVASKFIICTTEYMLTGRIPPHACLT